MFITYTVQRYETNYLLHLIIKLVYVCTNGVLFIYSRVRWSFHLVRNKNTYLYGIGDYLFVFHVKKNCT